MNAIKKIYAVLEDILGIVMSVLLAFMVVNIFGNVLLRYIFHYPITWTEELARYLMIYLAFLGMSLAIKYDEHVYLSFIVKLFPEKIQKGIVLLSRLIILFFLVVVLIYSIKVIPVLSRQKSPALQVTMYIPYFSVTLGSALMILHLFYLIMFGVKSGN